MMKARCAYALILSASSLLMTAGSRAEVLVYEPFDYDIGGLEGLDGGVGFDGPWVESDASQLDGFAQIVAPNGPLTYVVPGGVTVSGGDRALQVANETDFDLADDPELLVRDLEVPIDEDEIYISYLYRYEEGFIDDNDFVVWWFQDVDGGLAGTQGPVIGLKGNGGNGSQPEDLMARVGNWYASPQQEYAPDIDISEDVDTFGVDFFIVGRLSRADNSGDPDAYDQYDLWVNPSLDAENSPDATAIGLPENLGGLTYLITTIGMRAFNQEPDDRMLWDELRIGTTWNDVVNPAGGEPALKAGDANMDLEFNQLDLVQVQIAAKYLSGQPATWGEGDWDGAPGGSVGDPPAGNGMFDQLDIIAALAGGVYLTGPYAAIGTGGEENDEQASIVYNANTGEVGVNAPASTNLTSVNIDSASGIFANHNDAANLDGSFDTHAENNIFKATFGSTFGTLSFGLVAQPGLSEDFVAGDLTVIGSLDGGGGLGDVDLIYIPEPSALMLLVLAGVGLLLPRGTRR